MTKIEKGDNLRLNKSLNHLKHYNDNSKLILIENADHGFHTEGSIEKAIEETVKFIKINN